MSNNKHISKCIYSSGIVEYLYDEIDRREKSAFETHLSGCSNCTDELAAVAFARFSVQEWRDAKFANLKTPVIEIPFDRQMNKVTASTVSVSWLDRLRESFPISPIWAASGAIAALVVVLGLVFAAINIFQSAEIAEVKKNSEQIKVSPTTEIAAQKSKNVSDDNQKPEILSERTLESTGKKAVTTQNGASLENKKSVASKNTAVRISENIKKNKSAEQFSENAPANNQTAYKTVDKAAPAKARKVPGLVAFEEDEDNTLRLAELFDELDTEE